MIKILKIGLICVAAVGGGLLLGKYIHPSSFALLDPRGIIALKERNLMIAATLLMLLIVLPVFGLTIGIAWHYREGNTKARYTPDWDRNRRIEAIWWGFPCLIIAIVAAITWQSSHELDPFKPITSTVKPLRIQVVALDWKWLFIYPDQHIASLNYVQFPAGTPVDFEITSDAPMNSFWIPQLGGQIYAMAGMSTHLNLMANAPGSYAGSSANLSGKGFAGMRFVAQSTTQTDFTTWAEHVRSTQTVLDDGGYDSLARPSENVPTQVYATSGDDLYDRVIMKYMSPSTASSSMAGMPMNMGGTP